MKTFLITLLLLVIVNAHASGTVVFTAAQRQALQIKTAAIIPTTRNLGGLLPAKIAVPNAQLQVVTAPQQGLVEVLLLAEGESITAGQPLVRIQSPRLLELQSDYLAVHTRYRLAASNYQRDRKLNKEGIIAERRLLESKADYQELATSLARLRRILELAGMDEDTLATLESSRDLNSTLVILAPFDGVILEQLVEAGSRVEAADPIYRIASLDPLWMEVHVPLEQLGDTHIGQEVEIPELGVTGRIITIGHMVHGADQGVLIRAEVHEGSDKLRPGQFVQVQFAVTTSDIRFRIARSAVIYSKGNSFIFVEQMDGFAAYKVTVTNDEGNTLIIQADLPADARVAVSGTVAIKAVWLEGVD